MKARTSNSLERQLELTRAAYAPAPELRERVLEKLSLGRAPAIPGILPATPGGALGAASGSAWAALRANGLKALVGMGLLSLGFAAGWQANAARDEPPPLPSAPRSVAAEALVVLTPDTDGAAEVPLASERPAQQSLDSARPASGGRPVPATRVARGDAARKAPPPPGDSAARVELALLQRAERAVRADNAALGLALIAELETKYPHSKLLEERHAIELMAHCAAGATDGAARAERFLREQPRSIYAARIETLCKPRATPSQP
jgi:hypothetical protein